MSSKTWGYARVSSSEQHLDRQIEALRGMGLSDREIIVDKASRVSMDRPGYKALRDQMLRSGDTLIVKSLDRLSCNKQYTRQELEYFRAQHIRVMVMASIAEQERRMIKERQAEGIAVAKKNGKCLGRPRAPYPKNWEEVYGEWKAGNITAVMAMDSLRLKRSTFYNPVRKWEKRN